MPTYHIDTDGLERDDGEALAESIARKVLDVANRSPEIIHIMAIPGLRSVNASAFESLQQTGLDYEDEWLEGTIEATDATIEAVLQLFSNPLLKAVIRDEEDTPIFARHEYAAMSYTLSESTHTELEAMLSEEERMRINRLPEVSHPV